MAQQIRVPKGLEGVAVTETSISKSESDGSLFYRGYKIEELAEKSSFEEVAFLILNGYLPKKYELTDFISRLKDEMHLDERLYTIMRFFPKEADPMDIIRTVISAAGSFERDVEINKAQFSIPAILFVSVGNVLRMISGKSKIEPKEDLSFTENLLYMITSRLPNKEDAWFFERELIFYMEHDLNASSFTVRVVASTLSDPYSAVVSGLSALKGRLHGGANEAVMEYLLKLQPGEGEYFVKKELSGGRKIMGFGHRVYKKFDPRAVLSKKYLEKLAGSKKDGERLYKVCTEVENAVFQAKGIPANLDFYAAPIFYLLGIPVVLYTPIFASSRVFGWLAHYKEQIQDNKIFRPDAIYIGEKGKSYIPITER